MTKENPTSKAPTVTKMMEQCCSVVISTPVSCFLEVPSKSLKAEQMLTEGLKAGHNTFLLHSSQLTIHIMSFLIWCYITSAIDKVLLNKARITSTMINFFHCIAKNTWKHYMMPSFFWLNANWNFAFMLSHAWSMGHASYKWINLGTFFAQSA